MLQYDSLHAPDYPMGYALKLVRPMVVGVLTDLNQGCQVHGYGTKTHAGWGRAA